MVKTCAVPRIVSHRDDPAGQSSSGNVVRCVLTATHELSYSDWRGSCFTSAGKRTFHDTVIIMHLVTVRTHVLATRESVSNTLGAVNFFHVAYRLCKRSKELARSPIHLYTTLLVIRDRISVHLCNVESSK